MNEVEVLVPATLYDPPATSERPIEYEAAPAEAVHCTVFCSAPPVAVTPVGAAGGVTAVASLERPLVPPGPTACTR